MGEKLFLCVFLIKIAGVTFMSILVLAKLCKIMNVGLNLKIMKIGL